MSKVKGNANIVRVLSLMKRLVDKVTVIEYPDDSRSVDLVVEPRAGLHAIVKVSASVSTRKKDFIELKKISDFLNINALVVTESYNKEKLLENVLYIRGRIGFITPKTLESLCMDEPIYIYEYQGSYYVKVRGEALRELRSKFRLGYSMLAKMIGITSKSLYEYEQGKMGMSIEVAERFLEIFGDEFERVLERIDIFSFRIVGNRKVDRSDVGKGSGEKGNIAEKLEELGLGDVEVFNHIPPDLVIKSRHSKAFIALVSSNSSIEEVSKKCRENIKMAHELGGRAITLITKDRDRDVTYLAEECSDVVGQSLEDIAEFVYREERR